MKTYYLLLLMISTCTYGQGKFFGGPGDGFAAGEVAIILPIRPLPVPINQPQRSGAVIVLFDAVSQSVHISRMRSRSVIVIYGSDGKLYTKMEIVSFSCQVPVAAWPPGMYSVRVSGAGTGTTTKQFIKP